MSQAYRFVESVISILLIQYIYLSEELTDQCLYFNNNSNIVVVSALLPIHDDPNCTQIQLRGLQQMASLAKAVNEINSDLSSQEGLKLSLQIQDTCSTSTGSVKAALRALVENGQTCQHPPLFLGFIGLEDSLSLQSVRAITSMFNATHILPYTLEKSKLISEYDQNVIHITQQNYKEQSKAVLALVHQLHWKVLSLIFEDTLEPLVKEVIGGIQQNPSLCISGSVVRLSSEEIYDNILSDREGNSDGTIILLDNPETALKLFQKQMKNPANISTIISIKSIGLKSWQVPNSFQNIFLLQQASISIDNLLDSVDDELFEQYKLQELNKCIAAHNASICEMYQSSNKKLSNSVDASTSALNYAIRLLGSALRLAHQSQCHKNGEDAAVGLCKQLRKINVTQWQQFLKKSISVLTRNMDSNTSRIHVEDFPTYYDLYTINPITNKLEKIGKIKKGTVINTSGFIFNNNQEMRNCPSNSIEPQVPTKSVVKEEIPHDTLLDNFIQYKEYGSYQFIGLLCGVGAGMLLFLIVITIGVYNVFRVKSNKSGKSSSVNSSPSIRRRGRGSVMSNRSV